VGRHLVEQQDRLAVARGGAQTRLGQHHAHEQRLLLPGRAVAGQPARGPVVHQQIAAMRSDRGTARVRILPPGLGQGLGEALLDLERRQ
jgi:hypothetical protein